MNYMSKEILAYALQNAIEHGKSDASKILSKLFQHGLKKQDIKDMIPIIKKIVERVNNMSLEEREGEFSKLKQIVKERDVKKRGLSELENIKKKFVVRIAPFPSGALHIGNTKTFLLNALYAEKYKGSVIFVMDDTIGSSDKPPLKEAYGLIEDAFRYLGVKYKKPIIYKSDRLETYYKYAIKLIKSDNAYVCYCSQKELRDNRERGVECSCRHFPKKIQLERWKEMFNAKEGHAILRIKTSMANPNPAFRDRVLFKISDRKHPRVGNKYRVWPTLEMSWAIDDYLLGITHIIRGNELEIETQMERFIWKIFKWKDKTVIHTGLVNLEGAIGKISKSKSQQEILSGVYSGWEDPRTWSVQSLERRGIQKEAIREFVEEIGLNKQNITVPIDSLYSINRKLIDLNADRYSFIENPVEINLDTVESKTIIIPIHPEKKKTREVKIKNNIFVSKEDFEKNKEKETRLLHLTNIILNKKSQNVGNNIKKKIGKINWVSENVKAKILMPSGKWISGIAEKGIKEFKKGKIIQFERFGFVKFNGKDRGIYEFSFAHK